MARRRRTDRSLEVFVLSFSSFSHHLKINLLGSFERFNQCVWSQVTNDPNDPPFPESPQEKADKGDKALSKHLPKRFSLLTNKSGDALDLEHLRKGSEEAEAMTIRYCERYNWSVLIVLIMI